MKILYCGLRYDYGVPERGPALEYKNMYDTLTRMPGVEAHFFGIDDGIGKSGRDEMNNKLIQKVDELRPDLVFFVLFTEELKKETVTAITKKTKTFNWFGDDHWRVPAYSRYWAPLFTLVGTTDTKALGQYKGYGITNVVKTQWAVNHFLYSPKGSDVSNYDITFLGQNYGVRGKYISALQKAGLPAEGYGPGFPSGPIKDMDQMIGIYSDSKINLNFTETPYYGFKKKLNLFAKLFIKKEFGKYSLNLKSPISNFKSVIGTQRRTIKARTFEVPACGGFLLTGKSDEDISEYYTPGKEIEVFNNAEELIEKCRYYLDHPEERKQIALAGYKRTVGEHTYVHRFTEIFKRLHLM